MRASDWRGSNKGIPCEYGTPQGEKLIIEVHHPEAKTASGIIITEEVVRKEGHASMKATVLSIGFGAWMDKGCDWADVGDSLVIGRHVGTRMQDTDGKDIRVISDLDVLAVK